MKWKTRRKLRILDFDIENRPLSYWVPDRPSAEITAIAAGWVDVKRVECWMLTRKDSAPAASSSGSSPCTTRRTS
jgi:hypothetical protein